MNKNKASKSPFKAGTVRELVPEEIPVYKKVLSVLKNIEGEVIISTVPPFVSLDNKERPLILSKGIAGKIINDHGPFLIENLIINANDWEYVKLNIGGNPDKINLIKQIGNTQEFLRIGAIRINGYFILTHYENLLGDSQSLKNLLKGGDVLDRSGRTRPPAETGYSSFATSSEEAASQPAGLSGVRTDSGSLADS